jgi:GNAT superfamily N-acetyltransferase
METETVVSEDEEKEFREFMQSKIREYNNRASFHHQEIRKPGAMTPLNLIVKDEMGNPIGGISANTYWDWLDVEHFYLPEELRGKGIGSSLLHTAEGIAVKRGCLHSFLTTYDFQARVFYEKQGYVVVGRLDDYPPGSTYFWMRKDLLAEPA